VAISRAIEEANAGLVVETESAAIADSLAKLLGDKELRGRIGANAKALVEREFSLDVMGRRLVGLYEDILGRKAAAE
jgi:glycosyltransferase involved in cell wall biosynthesis